MYDAINTGDALITSRVKRLLEKLGQRVSEVLSPNPKDETDYPQQGKGLESNGNTLTRVFVSPVDEVWVFKEPGILPLLILPSEFVEDSKLTAKVPTT